MYFTSSDPLNKINEKSIKIKQKLQEPFYLSTASHYHASETLMVYPPTGSWPKEGRWTPRLHSWCCNDIGGFKGSNGPCLPRNLAPNKFQEKTSGAAGVQETFERPGLRRASRWESIQRSPRRVQKGLAAACSGLRPSQERHPCSWPFRPAASALRALSLTRNRRLGPVNTIGWICLCVMIGCRCRCRRGPERTVPLFGALAIPDVSGEVPCHDDTTRPEPHEITRP